MMFLLKNYNLTLRMVFLTLCFLLVSCVSNIKDTNLVNVFINRMVATYGFDKKELNELFQAVKIKEDIIKKISSPA